MTSSPTSGLMNCATSKPSVGMVGAQVVAKARMPCVVQPLMRKLGIRSSKPSSRTRSIKTASELEAIESEEVANRTTTDTFESNW